MFLCIVLNNYMYFKKENEVLNLMVGIELYVVKNNKNYIYIGYL